MARYRSQIDKLTSSRSSINTALSGKLSNTVNVRFCEIADKIREIESGYQEPIEEGGQYILGELYSNTNYTITPYPEYRNLGTLNIFSTNGKQPRANILEYRIENLPDKKYTKALSYNAGMSSEGNIFYTTDDNLFILKFYNFTDGSLDIDIAYHSELEIPFTSKVFGLYIKLKTEYAYNGQSDEKTVGFYLP